MITVTHPMRSSFECGIPLMEKREPGSALLYGLMHTTMFVRVMYDELCMIEVCVALPYARPHFFYCKMSALHPIYGRYKGDILDLLSSITVHVFPEIKSESHCPHLR